MAEAKRGTVVVFAKEQGFGRVAIDGEGELPFDWEMVLAIRGQIDHPDPAWLARLGRITARARQDGGSARVGRTCLALRRGLRPPSPQRVVSGGE